MRIGPNIYASMWPTIIENDEVRVQPRDSRTTIARLDIVTFVAPEVDGMRTEAKANDRYVKRVIGLPGECVEVREGVGIFVDGGVLREHLYVANKAEYSLRTLGDIGGMMAPGVEVRPYFGTMHASRPIVVPPQHYFVLGDNRNFSLDSHVFGFLPESLIEGTVEAIVERKLEAKTPDWHCSFCDQRESDLPFVMHGLGGFICTICIAELKQSNARIPQSTTRCILCLNWRDADAVLFSPKLRARACLDCIELACDVATC